MSRSLSLFALACFALPGLVACGSEAPDEAAFALERQAIVLPDDDGVPAYRVEATFVGAERAVEVQALLDTIEVVPAERSADGPSPAARAAHAIDALAADGGDGIVVQVHPLRAVDAGRHFGYTVHLVDQMVGGTDDGIEDGSDGTENDSNTIGTARHAITLPVAGIAFYDLWCWGLKVRYRIRSGMGLFNVISPMPAVLPARVGAWRETNLWAPAPWPSPWLVMVTNRRGDQNLVYDISLTCNL